MALDSAWIYRGGLRWAHDDTTSGIYFVSVVLHKPVNILEFVVRDEMCD
jgi:hypothetical protein